MNKTNIAYAAGAIDADGNITIKRTTQRMRNKGDCGRACYSPRISLGQITPQVPELLRKLFGGSIYKTKPGTTNSRPLFKWMISDKSAASAAKILLPLLRIKRSQAQAVIDLHKIRMDIADRRISTWYARENPTWKKVATLITTAEACKLMRYTGAAQVTQAIANGTLLSARRGPSGRTAVPRIPRELIDLILKGRRGSERGARAIAAPQHVARLQAVYDRVRAMNSLGVRGTCVTNRTGKFAPIG